VTGVMPLLTLDASPYEREAKAINRCVFANMSICCRQISAPVLQPGMKTRTGPLPGLPASRTRKETPSPTSTIRDDPVLDFACTRNAPKQMTANRSKTGRAIKVIAGRQITDEQPDLLPSIARVKFCQKGRVSRLQCPRLSRRRYR